MLRVGLRLRKLDFETVDGSAVMQLHGCFSLLVTAALSRYLSCSAISNNLVWTVLLKLLHHRSDHAAVPLYHCHYLQPKHSVDRFFLN